MKKVPGLSSMIYTILCLGLLSILSLVMASGTTLTIQTDTELCGDQIYDSVIINNSAVVTICAYNGTEGTGKLNFTVSGDFIMDSGTLINGAAKGFRGGAVTSTICSGATHVGAGGEGAGGGHGSTNGFVSTCGLGYGGAGGGFGNVAGDGARLELVSIIGGGSEYDNNTNISIRLGSGGGGGSIDDATNVIVGGNGGGGLYISANIINIHGNIFMNGSAGASAIIADSTAGAGGGAGGSVVLHSNIVNMSSSTININGGAGGSASSVGTYNNCGGGGGAGGRLKIFYGNNLYNISTINTVTGGSAGISEDCPTTGSASEVGGNGTIYILQDPSLFNAYPTLDSNETMPNTFTFGQENVYLNISTSDADNDSITGAYFNLTMPNSTKIIDYVNGAFISGDSILGQSEIWESARFNISNVTGHVGQWNWSVYIISNGTSANKTYSDSFTLIDSVSPLVNITSFADNQTIYNNVSIPLNFTYSDNVEVDSCWYSLNGGENVSIPDCGNITFGAINQSNNSLTLWANDTSNNLNFSTISNLTFIYDNINPVIEIIAPIGMVYSRTIDINIDVTDLGGADYCEYNITIGASTEVANTEMPSCDIASAVVSSDADYVINIFVNDTTGNFETISGNFSTYALDSSAGGGGSGIQNIIQQLIEPPKENICDELFPKFEYARQIFTKDMNWETFKPLWFAYWDYTLCKSGASIIPVEIEGN
ncbi:MAG: hypothetical protein OEL87_00025 [Nanoarchaeota archaeon]|nr:hypothetical protein [Nanoarchaeota archaeon]